MKQFLSLDNIRLRNKFLLLYLFCVLIPIIFTNVVFYHVTSENVKNQRMEDIQRALEQVKNDFLLEIEDAVSVSSVFFTDYNLNENLESEYERPVDYIATYDSYLRRLLNSYTPVYTTMQNIRIYLDNPTLLHSGAIGYLSEEAKSSPWYEAIKDTDDSYPIVVRTSREGLLMNHNSNVLDTFSVVRRMNHFKDSNKWEKILKIELRATSVSQLFNNLNLNGEIYLLNPQGLIEYTTDPNVPWSTERVFFENLELPGNGIEFRTNYEEVRYLRGWEMIGFISEEEVLREVRKSRVLVVWMATVNLLFSTIIIIWITRSMNVRLVSILRHMKKVKNQKFETINEAESRDEIGQLTGEFNRMTLQIKSLIDDVYKADIQKKSLEIERRQAQFNALQSQINPHFLFNSLETLRMRSLMKQEHETAKIIHNMAKIMRNSLTWKKDYVTVKEELDLIECFLEIQKYRFGDKLQYELHVDDAAMACKLPKMTILPFIENASIHGIEPLKSGGVITLRVELHGSRLICRVADNGNGMDEKTLKKLRGFVESEDEMGDRVGVQNVIYRLKLFYGDTFSFSINSARDTGTEVIVDLPGSS